MVKFFHLKKLFARIFRWSQNAIDIGIEDGYDQHIYGKSYVLTVTFSRPLFLRRRDCDHAHAKANGYVRYGKTWCLRCDRLISVDAICDELHEHLDGLDAQSSAAQSVRNTYLN